jgi:hypothetical protein
MRNRSYLASFTGANQELSPGNHLRSRQMSQQSCWKDRAANPVEYRLHALAFRLRPRCSRTMRGIHIEQAESSLEGDLDVHGFLD